MDSYIGNDPIRGASGAQGAVALPLAALGDGTVTTRPLVFFHIPKTAGTSLIELLARNFAAADIYRMTDVHRPIDHLATDVEIAVADGKRLICGHFPYPAVDGLRAEVVPFTMLRDPVDRIVSLYRFWRTQDIGAAQGTAARFACNLARALDFDAFIECEHPLIVSATRNEMCKTLCALPGDQIDAGLLYPSAKISLDGMPFGLVNRMQDSLRLLSHRLGLHLIEPICLNASDPEYLPMATSEQRERILRRNLADVALFDHASRIFDRAIQQLEVEQLYRALGDRALTPVRSNERGQFRWDAAMSVSGTGLNDREALADGTCYRFTSGPETIVYLPNHMGGNAFSIEIVVAFFNNDALLNQFGIVDPLEALSFALNDEMLAVSTSPACTSGTTYIMPVPASDQRGPILQLAMRSAYGLPPSLFGSPDRRNLLAAVSSITIRA